MFELLSQPVIFAHRGASAYAPENTLAAFELAHAQGAAAIEFDVKLSADDRPVILHDRTVDRTTDGSGRVANLTLAALRELDAGSWLSADFRGEKIPTLDEVFETIGRKLFMNVELTNYASPFDALVPTVAAAVRKHGLQERILFSSFFPHNLMRMARLLPEVPRGQLVLPRSAGWWQRIWGRLIPVRTEHYFADDVTRKLVTDVHARGRRLYAWTVNAPDQLRRLKDLGVDGVFSDDPPLALELMRAA